MLSRWIVMGGLILFVAGCQTPVGRALASACGMLRIGIGPIELTACDLPGVVPDEEAETSGSAS